MGTDGSYFASYVAAGYVLTALAMAYILISFGFVIVFRHKHIVAMAQPRMLSSLCLGALLFATANIFLTINSFPPADDDSLDVARYNRYCKTEFWVRWLGMVVTLSTLIAKLYRVYIVTSDRAHQTMVARHAMPLFLLLLMLGIYANIAVQVIFPPEYTVVPITIDDTTALQGMCYPEDSFGFPVVYFAKVIMEGPLELAILGFACHLRDVREELGESRRILKLGFFNVGVYVAHWGGWLLVARTPNGMGPTAVVGIGFLVSIVCYALHATSMVGFLILPRMYYVGYEHFAGRLPDGVLSVGNDDDESSSSAYDGGDEDCLPGATMHRPKHHFPPDDKATVETHETNETNESQV